MQVYCDFYSCIYNEDECCCREKIFLDSNGECESYVFDAEEEKQEEEE